MSERTKVHQVIRESNTYKAISTFPATYVTSEFRQSYQSFAMLNYYADTITFTWMFRKQMRTAPKHKGKGVYMDTHPAHQIVGTTPISIYTYNSCRTSEDEKNGGVTSCKEGRLAEETLVADHGQLVR
jgi:hypothetical protein